MSKYSLEYTLFSSKEAPSAEEFSDLVLRLCLFGEDCGVGCDLAQESTIASVVDILHSFRTADAQRTADDDEKEHEKIPVVENPEKFFLDEIRKIDGNPDSMDFFPWEDFWPTKCKWHPHELKKLARLAVGERDQWDNEVKRTMA